MSDHIPDVTKMISDTPRTESFKCYDSGCDDPLYAWGAFAAELECELNAASERIHILIAERDTARRQADQNYKLREEFRELLGTDDVEQGVAMVRGLKERIKRLEEAGNNLLWNFCPEYTSDLTQEQSDALKQWNKAKEAKP